MFDQNYTSLYGYISNYVLSIHLISTHYVDGASVTAKCHLCAVYGTTRGTDRLVILDVIWLKKLSGTHLRWTDNTQYTGHDNNLSSFSTSINISGNIYGVCVTSIMIHECIE